MHRDRWRRIDELFAAALERDAAARERFLEEACAGDPDLRAEVDALVRCDEQAAGFIEQPVFDLAAVLLTAVEPPGEVGLNRPSTDSGPIDGARFVPGDLLAGRYRIVDLLGRGGMGEVYRADDLRLRQAVALKFLPERLARDAAALARMWREVSVARRIAHRHVCRVYDVGEAGGQHFLTMELVRGEELGSLLRRVGRFPPDRAVDVARQLCAGLAAIHGEGVLHRDLKPSNVMIDERGDVRIADFGLAATAEEARGPEARAGTPAYMAPEQLSGGAPSVRSDVFALGLVLYEVFTGRRAFDASSIPELLDRQRRLAPPSPSSLVEGLDPAVERVLMRCLDPHPERRPGSALEVAAAFPGGDPLAAALAAGETPSPEMVAAAPRAGTLRPALALLLVATLAAGLAVACFLSRSVLIHRRVPLARSADALEARAGDVLDRLGVGSPGEGTARGFALSDGFLFKELSDAPWPSDAGALASAEPPILVFWSRRAPTALVPETQWTVDAADPPADRPGMVDLALDTRGRLRSFTRVPSPLLDAEAASEVDWTGFFVEAGLDRARFEAVAPALAPRVHGDRLAAWTGTYPENPDVPVRIEAASRGGRPVAFDVLSPWDVEARTHPTPAVTPIAAALVAVFALALLGSAALASRNLRLGRGDRRGAFRTAATMAGATLLLWAFGATHTAGLAELGSLLDGAGTGLMVGGFVWLVYIALEPFVRRRWPELIVSWTRVLSGRVSDPLVGRDVLVGLAAGAWFMTSVMLTECAADWIGAPGPPKSEPGSRFLGLAWFPYSLLMKFVGSVIQALHALFILVLVAALTRRRLLAAGACWLVAFLLLGPVGNGDNPAGWPFAALSALLGVGVLARFGLLALITALFTLHAFVFFPITTELGAWYATGFVADLAVLGGLAAFAYKTAVAGQPLLPRALAE